MSLYSCPICRHMPAEHGPEGCTAPVTVAAGPKIERHTCGCRAMVNGELVGPTGGNHSAEAVHGQTTGDAVQRQRTVGHREPLAPASSLTQLQEVRYPMGVMDQINQQVGPPPSRMDGNLAGAEVKNRLWVNKVPFEITAPPQRRQKPAQFMVPRQDGTMPHTHQWWVPVRLLQFRNDGTGTFGYVLEPDGEGGQAPVDHILTFEAGDYRDGQLNAVAAYVQQNGTAGPLKLTKGDSARGNPPWILADWTASDFQGAAYSPPAQAPAAQPLTSAPQPANASVPSSAVVSSQGKPYTHRDDSTGKKLGWHEGLPGWEEVKEAPPPVPPPLPGGPPPLPMGQPGVVSAAEGGPPSPLPGHSEQPIPATRLVRGLANSEGMPSAQVAVEQADGSQIRQSVYRGGGVVDQPSGVATQNAAGQEPRTRHEAGGTGVGYQTGPGMAAQTAATPGGVLGVEEPASAAPGPAPALVGAGMGTSLLTAWQNRQPIGVTAHCGRCGVETSTPAFYNPAQQVYLQTHTCKTEKKMVAMDVTAEVKQLVGVP